MLIQQFNGGQNSRVRPQYIAPNEAQLYENIDNTVGSLTPVRNTLPSGIASARHAVFFEETDTFVSDAAKRDYVEFRNRLYWTHRFNIRPQKSNGLTEFNLGIDVPTFATFSVVSGAGNLNGTYQYVVTHYNSSDGSESGPSPLSTELITTDDNIQITNLPQPSDVQVDKIRIYRVGGNRTVLSLVTQVDVGVTSFLDDIADEDIEGTALASGAYLPAPAELRYLTQTYGMLFATLGNQLRYTPIGVPDAWPALFFINYESELTGLAVVANGLLVFTRTRTYLVTGTSPGTLSSRPLDLTQGCVSHDSVRSARNAALWASTDGLCTSSGGLVQLLSKEKLGNINLTAVSSVIFDEAYYLLQEDGTVFVYDYGYGGIFKFLRIDIDSLVVGDDRLYGHKDGFLLQLFAGDSFETMRYRSARFFDGLATNNKAYKRVNIYSKGDIIIKILIDDEVVQTRILTGTGSFDISVPETKKRGFFMQFDIEGTGEVYEIDVVNAGQTGGR